MALLQTDEIRERLKQIAREVGAGNALPTARILRERLSTSNATLSAALDELAARGEIIRKPGSGVYVSDTLSQTRLALVVNPEHFAQAGVSPFWGQLLREAQQRARAGGESLRLHFAEHSESDPPLPLGLAEDIRKGRFSGVLAIGLEHDQARWIEGQNIPVVAFAGAARCLVQVAGDEVIHRGVGALARRGCQHIGLLIPALDSSASRTFHTACTAHEIKGQIFVDTTADSFAERGWKLAEAVINADCDAALGLDDTLTQGFLMHLHRLNATRKLVIATHSNASSPTLLGWEDQLIRLEFDPALIVSSMFACLDALMCGALPEGTHLIGEAGFPPVYSEPIHALTLSPNLILPWEAV